MHPSTRGQPLHKGRWLWHRLKLLHVRIVLVKKQTSHQGLRGQHQNKGQNLSSQNVLYSEAPQYICTYIRIIRSATLYVYISITLLHVCTTRSGTENLWQTAALNNSFELYVP